MQINRLRLRHDLRHPGATIRKRPHSALEKPQEDAIFSYGHQPTEPATTVKIGEKEKRSLDFQWCALNYK